MEVEFYVPGQAVPAGSKRAFPIHSSDGKIRVAVTDASGMKGKEWRAQVREVASRVHGGRGLLPGPLSVAFTFHTVRPKVHYSRKGGVKPTAPPFPIVRPDVLKLARAIEDALSGIIWRDDAQIVVELLVKEFAETPGVRVKVREL